jgi:hypothetical protein
MLTLAHRLIFAAGQSSDEEQLLRLFWNRASLKKQFEKLRNENFALSERLKQEEMLKLRVQQELEQLESRLANPATAAAAITYYQLKELWNRCALRLAVLASELWKAEHDIEYRKHATNFRRGLYKSLSVIQRELHDVSRAGEALSAEILTLREGRSKRRGFWNFFRRRALTASIRIKRVQRRELTMRIGELTEEIQSCSSAQPPPFEGLPVATKRAINLALIAHAQELYLHFADQELASRAREASLRRVADVDYGSTKACREFSRYLEGRYLLLQADQAFESRVQIRVAYLTSVTRYGRDKDTLPASDTLAAVPLFMPAGDLCGQISVNVLAEEYWDIRAALLD